LPLVLRDFRTSGPCVEGITNGGFESDEDWEIPLTGYPAGYTTAAAYSGGRSMRVGIVEPADDVYSYSSVRQMVTIPADAISATLRFWLYPVSEESPADPAFPTHPLASTIQEVVLSGDAQYVLILDESDQRIGTLIWQRRDDRAWTFHQFDLDHYAGGRSTSSTWTTTPARPSNCNSASTTTAGTGSQPCTWTTSRWRSASRQQHRRQAAHPAGIRSPQASLWDESLDSLPNPTCMGRTCLHLPLVCPLPRIGVLP
jgi:hypothetical protein